MIIYKYRNLSQLNLEVVTAKSLYFTTAESFNDPFDTRTRIVKSDPAKWPQYNTEYVHFFNSMIPKIEKDYNTKLRCLVPFCCFSKSDTINLVWSHYADNHSGIAFGFSINVDNDGKVNDEDFLLGVPVYGGPVEYKDQLYSIEAMSLAPGSSQPDGFGGGFFTKLTDWSYEQEIRIGPNKPEDIEKGARAYQFNPSRLVEVTYGLNMRESQKSFYTSAIAGHFNRSDIMFKEIYLKNDRLRTRGYRPLQSG